jgi:hypothetical protein
MSETKINRNDIADMVPWPADRCAEDRSAMQHNTITRNKGDDKDNNNAYKTRQTALIQN